ASDWSSDVCSSDLDAALPLRSFLPPPHQGGLDRQHMLRKLSSASRTLAGSPPPRGDGNKHSDIKSVATRGWLPISHRCSESAVIVACGLHLHFARQHHQ